MSRKSAWRARVCAVFLIGCIANCATQSASAQPADAPERLARILAIDNWDESRFAKFVDRELVSIDEQLEMTRLAQRLETLDARLFDVGATQDSSAELAADPDRYRGQLIRLSGRAIAFAPVELPSEDAQRLGVERVYAVRFATGKGPVTTVISLTIPRAWLELKNLDEPVAAAGVFTKVAPADTAGDMPVIVAPRVAWYPTRVKSPQINFGMSVLGTYGYDVAQIDHIAQRERLTRRESAAFYSLLDKLKEVGPNQLARFGERHMPSHVEEWQTTLTDLGGKQPPIDADARKRWELAKAVLVAAESERYSIAPFFNEPERHVGELVVLDGTVRRVVRIDLAGGLDGAADPTANEFDVSYYYEIDLFTGDSQNFPVVFCVRELPDGFPTGDDLSQEVRVAGFFFKNWRFNTGRPTGSGNPTQLTTPLFVGSGLLTFAPTTESFPWSLVAGSTFVAVMGILWIALWRTSRSDRRQEKKLREHRVEEALSFDLKEEDSG